jgi:hypothetical protein
MICCQDRLGTKHTWERHVKHMISLCNIRWRFRVFAENFDLSYIVERDWDTLREKLNGKMHVYCGTMDNFYLNNAVYMFEARVNALVAAEDGAAGKEVRVRNTMDPSHHFTFHGLWKTMTYRVRLRTNKREPHPKNGVS